MDLPPRGTEPQTTATSDSMAELRAASDQAAELITTFSEFIRAVELRHYLDADSILKRNKGLTDKLQMALYNLGVLVGDGSIETFVGSESRLERLHYKQKLESALIAEQIEFRGQWPSYTISDVIQIQAAIEIGRVTIDGKRLDSIEVSAVVERTKQRLSELLGREFDASLFFTFVEEAYAESASGGHHGYGEYVDIKRMATSVREKMRSRNIDAKYNEAKFATDLYRLQSTGFVAHDRRLELSPAQNAAGGLYVPSEKSGNYIAAIRFVRLSG